jgi:sugar transferase (PEP-CTERM/EpsH1 system associated)
MTDDPRPLIIHVIHHLVIGGMENGLVNLINHLPEREFRHTVVCIDDHSSFAQRIQRDDVDVIDLRRRTVGVWPVRKALLRLFRERRPRIVHTRGPSGLDALPPAALARVPRRIHGEHGWDMTNLDGRSLKPLWLRRLHSPLVNRYVTVSRDLQRYLVNTVGIAEDRITTICNGVDTERFRPGEPEADLGLPGTFLQPGVVRMGTVGRLQPVKDQGTLVAAAAAVVSESPELRQRLRVILVGDGPMRRVLTEQVQAAGIDDIVFFTGASDRVDDWLHALDVFVLPSLNEGISNTLLEAMACGLPTLATPVGGNGELLDAGVSGHFFAPGHVEALGGLIRQYLDHPDERRRHGAAARTRAEQHFSLRVMVSRYGELYRQCALGGRP